VVAGEAPLLDQGSLFVLLQRVGVLGDFQLVYSQLAASCSAMAAAVAAFHHPKQVQCLLLSKRWHEQVEVTVALVTAFVLLLLLATVSSAGALQAAFI